jgi:tRNA dimethylallyltransferase
MTRDGIPALDLFPAESESGMSEGKLLVITGPTASGKTRLALEVALRLCTPGLTPEILSADSAQVYRGMNVGTDKLLPHERQGIPHHLIDLVDPDEDFSAARWALLAREVLDRLAQEGKPGIVVGGTGFYLRALLRGLFPGPAADPVLRARLEKEAEASSVPALHERLRQVDPESANRIHPNDLVRIIRALEVFDLTGEPLSRHFARQSRGHLEGFRVLRIGLEMPRPDLYQRINQRVEQMFAQGLVEEVKGLRAKGYGPELKSQKIIGYRQAHAYLDGSYNLDRAKESIQLDSRHYARRQLTWMRAEADIHWLNPDQARESLPSRLDRFFSGEASRA